MWVVKGVLLGILLLLVGGISYIGMNIAIGLYRLTQRLTAVTKLPLVLESNC